MFLKNYDIFKKLLNTNKADAATTPFKREDGYQRYATDSPFTNIGFYMLGRTADSGNNPIDWYLTLGTGTAQPSYTDYTLTNKLSTNFSITDGNSIISLSNNKVLLTFSCVATWQGTSEVTVTEYGLGRHWISGYGGTETLLYKDLFSEGITFQPNESKTFTFNIELG